MGGNLPKWRETGNWEVGKILWSETPPRISCRCLTRACEIQKGSRMAEWLQLCLRCSDEVWGQGQFFSTCLIWLAVADSGLAISLHRNASVLALLSPYFQEVWNLSKIYCRLTTILCLWELMENFSLKIIKESNSVGLSWGYPTPNWDTLDGWSKGQSPWEFGWEVSAERIMSSFWPPWHGMVIHYAMWMSHGS